MRAQSGKTARKKQEGKEKKLEDDSNSVDSDTEEDSEEEEYHSTDLEETESEYEEVQRERKSKKMEEESVNDTNPEPEAEPEPIIEFGPQPRPESNIEGGAEPIIEVGHEPPEVLEEMMAECRRAEQDIERKKEEADAEIKACDEAEAKYRLKRTTSMENASESEIDLAIRKTVKDVVAEAQEMEKQEREAAPTLNKM
ncbi:hypothetical protein PIB30_084435 [Stylosanthes scabra]|uniref:Uncharacterized protein n=1 Tax=Stylosanthes scabra TaxID=79078 RepID=A0ABU6TT86_9FABA|nr:hypothetical protein [Stylosanthes scabra]